jgi:integrase
MMWVEPYGQGWRIRDRIGGRKVTLHSGYALKTEAKAAMVQARADQLRGDALVPRGGRLLVTDLINLWWPLYVQRLKPTAQHSEGGRVRNHILPLLGHLALNELDALVVNQWIAVLSERMSPKTVSNCHGLLHSLMRFAVDQRYLRSNPCAGSLLPRRQQREMRFLTDPEIGRLLAATPEHWRPLVLTLVATGLRWGEAIALRVGRVDLLATRPRLLVVEHLHELASTGEMVFTDPKSARSRRTVSVTTQLAHELAPLVAGKGEQELVFLTPTGAWVRARNFRRIWLRVTEQAGLAGLRIHDLRHTHAAILISAGRPLSAISRRLGHSSISVTDTLYGHIREEADDGILAAVDSALAGLSTPLVEDRLVGHGWGNDRRVETSPVD